MDGYTVFAKLFGLTEEQILKRLADAGVDCNGLLSISENCLDAAVSIYGDLDERGATDIKREVYRAFSFECYASEDISLAARVAQYLEVKGFKLSVAESLTGGLLAAKIVSVPGVAKLFYEGIVAYNNSAKCRRLLVNPVTISKFGAVSEQTACEMAKGLIKNNFAENPDIGLSTTGVAGPDKDERDNPVGLVYIGLYAPDYDGCQKYEFSGDRQEIRGKSANSALFYLLRYLRGDFRLTRQYI